MDARLRLTSCPPWCAARKATSSIGSLRWQHHHRRRTALRMRDERLAPAFGWSCPPGNLERHGTPQVPDDLLARDCVSFSFRRAELAVPRDRAGSIEANNGESMPSLRASAALRASGGFAVEDYLSAGQLVPLLEAYNPQGREPCHALFEGGSTMPTRVRVFVDLLAERLGASGTGSVPDRGRKRPVLTHRKQPLSRPRSAKRQNYQEKMVLPVRIELTTSALPRMRSTTELRQHCKPERNSPAAEGPMCSHCRRCQATVASKCPESVETRP